jgi:hypothetical protein
MFLADLLSENDRQGHSSCVTGHLSMSEVSIRSQAWRIILFVYGISIDVAPARHPSSQPCSSGDKIDAPMARREYPYIPSLELPTTGSELKPEASLLHVLRVADLYSKL